VAVSAQLSLDRVNEPCHHWCCTSVVMQPDQTSHSMVVRARGAPNKVLLALTLTGSHAAAVMWYLRSCNSEHGKRNVASNGRQHRECRTARVVCTMGTPYSSLVVSACAAHELSAQQGAACSHLQMHMRSVNRSLANFALMAGTASCQPFCRHQPKRLRKQCMAHLHLHASTTAHDKCYGGLLLCMQAQSCWSYGPHA
jgi:hypothetical protein